MATKNAITKKEVTSSRPNKNSQSSSEEVTEAWLNQLIRKIRECIASEGGSVTLKMKETEFESLIEGVTRAKRFKSLNGKYAKLAEDYEKRDDEVLDWLIKSEYAKKALPRKGVLPKHRREALHRMGFEAFTIGRPIYYDPIRVKDYYESAKDAALKKFGTKKLSQEQHAWVVAKVFEEFSFPSENATRLEQRKGRIQRIGQARSEIWIANLRYRDSVEDQVHQVLADRLEAIHGLFGQIPDTLEDVWVQIALNDEEAANQLIDRTTATRNPFDAKYSKVEDADWETCSTVLNPKVVKEQLSQGW